VRGCGVEQLTVGSIVSNGLSKGLKNVVSIAVNLVLWALTVWIPYLNVGTTIGLVVGLTAKAGRNEAISPTEIFNPVYRKRMGEFFLVSGLLMLGELAGIVLLVIPGIVIAIAWSLGYLLVVDKEMNPTEGISRSNSLTYGKKWRIFFGYLVLGIVDGILLFLAYLLFRDASEGIGIAVGVVFYLYAVSVFINAAGHIYNTLTANLQ
jgi:uncharacterized membrane protein